MRGKLSLIAVLAMVLAIVWSAMASIKDVTETSSAYESQSAFRYTFQTPVLAPSQADTAEIIMQIPDLPYFEYTYGPTWRIILGARTDVSGVNNATVEVWHGISRSSHLMYRSIEPADGALVAGVPKSFDFTDFPLSSMRELTIFFVNADTTAASFDIDLFLLKGTGTDALRGTGHSGPAGGLDGGGGNAGRQGGH